MMGASTVLELYKPQIAEVFAQAADKGVKLVWLQGQSDSGCTVSLIQGTHPDLYDAVLKLNVNIMFHPTIMVPSGEEAASVLQTITPDVLVVEGSIPTGEKKHACVVGEVGGREIILEDCLKDLAAKTKVAVVAVGNCAAFGGIPAGKPNPTNAKSVSGVLGKTVVNIPGCPAHPDWVLLTLASVLIGVMPTLDALGRPTAFFGVKLHDECPRRGFYDAGKYAENLSDEGCLINLGCRGPVTLADCASRKWNGGMNMCTNAGAPCIGCTHPEFPDKVSPFYVRTEALPDFYTHEFFKYFTGAVTAGLAGYVALDAVNRRRKAKEEK
ncbi:MAG: hydrogenase small subunit [Euryarchaeota archaeon]|nr:hydrogenase small subunit [Euryarchaeota archaeon]